MLFPIACFSCGTPVQQHEEQYYKLVDKYTKKQNESLVYAIKDESTFEQNVINLAEIYKENESLNQLAFFYKYSPEFLALKDIGIDQKRYCCRRMFLCHPRNLDKLI